MDCLTEWVYHFGSNPGKCRKNSRKNLLKMVCDRDMKKWFFLRLVNTQYVIAQNTRIFYRHTINNNIRVFIRIYHKRPAILLITGLSNYLSYSNAFFGWSFSGEDTSSFSPLENFRYTFLICVRYCATFGYLVASSNSLSFVALLSWISFICIFPQAM